MTRDSGDIAHDHRPLGNGASRAADLHARVRPGCTLIRQPAGLKPVACGAIAVRSQPGKIGTVRGKDQSSLVNSTQLRGEILEGKQRYGRRRHVESGGIGQPGAREVYDPLGPGVPDDSHDRPRFVKVAPIISARAGRSRGATSRENT